MKMQKNCCKFFPNSEIMTKDHFIQNYTPQFFKKYSLVQNSDLNLFNDFHLKHTFESKASKFDYF